MSERAAVNTPRFGPKLDPDEHKHHMGNFGIEAYGFTDYGRERARHVNILHLSTDLDKVRPEMKLITKFMRKEGYEMEHERNLGLSSDRDMLLAGNATDMVIMGSDAARCGSIRYVLWCMEVGWFGIAPYWDALWYGMDGVPEPHVKPIKPNAKLSYLPLRSGREFALDGVCLLHAHIRRRDDALSLRGEYVSLLTEIEGRINRLMEEEDAWREYSTKTKFKKFKDRLVEEGRSKPEIEMLLAAVSVLRNNRNIGSHPLTGLPWEEIEKKSLESMKQTTEFRRLAKKYGRPLWPSIVLSSRACHHTATRWEYSIARMAITWLEEYSKLFAEY